MRLLLRAYPRRWRDRYGEELLALLEADELTWRAAANVVATGLGERLRGPRLPHLRVLWAWSFFVVGGMAFQKTSEHWQSVVPNGHRAVPAAAFDVVQVAAAIGSAAVLAGVALVVPAFARHLREGGWPTMRRPILTAAAATTVTAGGLVGVAADHDVAAAVVFVAGAAWSLFAWTHAAAVAGRALTPHRAHGHLALVVSATTVVMTLGATVWFGSVTAHAPSFVGAGQLAFTATFMLLGVALAVDGARALRA